MMMFFKFIFVVLLCFPLGYVSLKLMGNLGNDVKDARKAERMERERRMQSGSALSPGERRNARKLEMGRRFRK